VTNAVVKIQDSSGLPNPSLSANHGIPLLLIVLAGVVGGIVWNLLTWLLGLPSSSSHALFGGLIGSTVAGLGWSAVNWSGDGTKLDGVVGKVILPGVMSPILAAIVAGIGTWLTFRVIAKAAADRAARRFRWGQVASASMVSLAHGTNDAQKTMGVITLALIGAGDWHHTDSIPVWVKLCCALAISLGTFLGGWRIIRTVGKGLVEIQTPQGMAAESASAAVILASSHLGFALSTTHVATGSILGSGVGRPGATVRWSVAGRMVVAWLITLPAAGIVGAVMWWVGDGVEKATSAGLAGVVIDLVLIALAAYIFQRSRRSTVNHANVNDEWDAFVPETALPAEAGV
jgi:PiT family inorganic phosphate transporter